jgi:alkanesulfonate monooxygenase SsuD/methylene tetrahydromethanopterin reductase-like flavin-dependent oxidoreductase (luciferase family)
MKFYAFIQGAWYGRTKPASEVYDDIMEEALLAEELGYDGIFLAEQNLVTFLATPDPVQIAAQIAQRTKKLRIGIAIFVLPLHHPLRLAGEIAQLDVLSGGRFEAGVGRGASPHQLRQFEKLMENEESKRFFKEHLDIMIRHWTNPDEDQSYDGEFFNYPAATVLPQSIQRPHPPIWVASIAPQTTKWAVELGFENSNHFMSAFREPFSYVEAGYRAFEEGLQNVGRDRSSSMFAINRHTYVAETEEEAREALPWIQKGHRVVAQQVISRNEKIINGEYQTEEPIPGEPPLDEMFENTLMGTPDAVREKVRQYAELGVDMISTWHHFGMPHEQVMKSMRLFAKEVMPEFQNNSVRTAG